MQQALNIWIGLVQENVNYGLTSACSVDNGVAVIVPDCVVRPPQPNREPILVFVQRATATVSSLSSVNPFETEYLCSPHPDVLSLLTVVTDARIG